MRIFKCLNPSCNKLSVLNDIDIDICCYCGEVNKFEIYHSPKQSWRLLRKKIINKILGVLN